MAEKEKFSDRVQDQVSKLEDNIDRVKAQVKAANSQAIPELRAQRDKAEAARTAREQEIDAARARMKARFDAKRAETDAKIDEWKARRDVERLNARAQVAEDYFSATMDIADAALREAGAAALDAIEARRVADEASSSPGSRT